MLPRERVISNCGSDERVTYVPVYGEDGKLKLEVADTSSQQDFIDSFADSCDIEILVNRYLNGDASALAANPSPAYGDFRNIPRDFYEAVSMVNKGRSLYDGLAPELKKEFGSFKNFVSADSKTFESKASSALAKITERLNPKVETTVESEVVK